MAGVPGTRCRTLSLVPAQRPARDLTLPVRRLNADESCPVCGDDQMPPTRPEGSALAPRRQLCPACVLGFPIVALPALDSPRRETA